MQGRTPLLAAIVMSHADVVNNLLVWGAQIDAIDNEGRSILQIAAAYGSVDIVQVLLARGLDEQHRDNQVSSLPHSASHSPHAPVFRSSQLPYCAPPPFASSSSTSTSTSHCSLSFGYCGVCTWPNLDSSAMPCLESALHMRCKSGDSSALVIRASCVHKTLVGPSASGIERGAFTIGRCGLCYC